MEATFETPGVEIPDLISVPDAARILNVSRATAYRLVETGTIPAFHVGVRKLLRIDRRELMAWLYSESPEPTELDVDQLEAVLGRDRDWINAQMQRGLPCQWNGRGEVVSVRQADLPAWQAAVKREAL